MSHISRSGLGGCAKPAPVKCETSGVSQGTEGVSQGTGVATLQSAGNVGGEHAWGDRQRGVFAGEEDAG